MLIENVKTFNLEGAILGMRFPMQSWEKSDSYYNDVHFGSSPWSEYVIGPNDLALARKLINAGSDHSKFIRQILVSMDITAPRYWWSEFDQYKIATTTNSESTMHTIMKVPFTTDMFSVEKIRGSNYLPEQKPNIIDEDSEKWRPWPINDTYWVSDQGRVKRKAFWAKNGSYWSERILTNTITTDGYLKVGVLIIV